MVSTVVLAVTSARGLPSPFNHNYTTKYYCTFPSSAYGTRVHQKMCQEQAVMPVPPAMLRTSLIASETNDTISILLFSHLESTAKSKDLLQS